MENEFGLVYVCVYITSHQSVRCVQIRRWMSFNLWQWSLRYLGTVANANTYSIPPTPPVPTVFWILVYPSPRKYLLSLPHLSPIKTASLSLCTRFSPPISPWRGATVHLDGASARRPPPLVCASLPWRPARGVPRASLWLPSLVRLSPLWRPRPAPRSLTASGVFLSEGPFLYLLVSIILTLDPPPAILDRRPSTLTTPSGYRRVLHLDYYVKEVVNNVKKRMKLDGCEFKKKWS